ncbi:hypothetical protein H257_12292 [Aphanomyces astaci]|uniref:Uncharacterized protein n=1 Tax=Aphanomyces astaci TaxID=112090 RepID=W4G207_APHAT|nr:hypothetical protein H257_12292 [Aphanomyces astaci]ETV72968.1 hypothetical protein H257_12292 [Aphanomyces astaci]|eukprot:XP_009837754.1 hypothetical protein H257_12292 [Aphanomyces astaci]
MRLAHLMNDPARLEKVKRQPATLSHKMQFPKALTEKVAVEGVCTYAFDPVRPPNDLTIDLSSSNITFCQ